MRTTNRAMNSGRDADDWAQIAGDVAICERCPRLVAHHAQVALTHTDYHCAPVPCWGPDKARLLIVGLAPGLHGAARTGLGFVGDDSGTFLFSALERAGFARIMAAGGVQLRRSRITNAVKCLPPANQPTAQERDSCRPHLERELGQFRPHRGKHVRAVLCLGGVAWVSVAKALGMSASETGPFAHGAAYQAGAKLHVFGAFHPSRLNVNTRRLTAAMLDAELAKISAFLT